jgi:hypothetical protein
MGKINWSRVFLGGLLAGVVLMVVGGINFFVFREDLTAALEPLGRPLELTAGNMVFWFILHFVVGITAVWLYAAIRPRYGPGPKTAACAGVAFWFITSLADVAWISLVPFPLGLGVTLLVIYLVVFVVATLAGAWAYKEA